MIDEENPIASLIRESREARHWSQKDLAERAGTSQQNIDRIESGLVKTSKFIPPVMRALGLDLGKVLSLTTKPGDLIPKEMLVGDKGMPLYSATEGGEGAIIVNFEPVDYIKWPAPLLHVPEGFGVLIVEESMSPVFEPGDIALVNPRILPRKNKHCVLLSPETGTPQVRSVIKRYVGQSETQWRVSQWNPQKEFDLSKAEWPRCYSVVGKYDAR